MRHTILALLLMLAALLTAPVASACDPGSYYDPIHQICQASPPAYPRPFYPGQTNRPYPPSDPRWGQ